jgi:hypothetical protein
MSGLDQEDDAVSRCWFGALGLAGIQSSLVPAYAEGMRVVEELPDLDACPFCRVED